MSQAISLPAEDDYLVDARKTWDDAATTFDVEPDHGMNDPLVKAAWKQCLMQWLPTTACRVLDLGSGTGSLSVLVAALGHEVLGIDCSPKMIKLAQAKAAMQNLTIDFQVMDAANPTFAPASFDVVMCRHVLWALPDPAAVLERWKNLLLPSGSILLIEGFWMTGGGLKAKAILDMLPTELSMRQLSNLSPHAALWGKPVNDERYAILLTR